MIGTGVFTSLGFQIAAVDSVFALLMLWLVGGLIALTGALSYGELGAALPRSGGEYHLLSSIYHPFAGFLAGWVSILIGFSAPTALAAMAMASYFTQAFPGINETLFSSLVVIALSFIHSSNLKAGSYFQVATTLLKILLGLCRPDSGRIIIDGRAVDDDPSYRGRIGYMPQMARYPAHRTGRELLGSLSALRPDMVIPDLTLAEAFDLGDQFDRPLGVLSGGTRQKVNAVLAFAFRPTLLILDEPTAGLDPVACRVLKERLLLERQRGTTVLLTSHVLPELDDLAEDLLYLDDGMALWSGAATLLQARTGQHNLEAAVAQLMAGGPLLEVA